MGYIQALGECFTCGNMMRFNPELVPSYRDSNNVKQPICRRCVEQANPTRIENGLEPITILAGAYEAAPESEEVE